MIEKKYFLVQIKRTNHAYLGAYGYGNNADTDYVACYVFGDTGATYDSMIDDRRKE